MPRSPYAGIHPLLRDRLRPRNEGWGRPSLWETEGGGLRVGTHFGGWNAAGTVWGPEAECRGRISPGRPSLAGPTWRVAVFGFPLGYSHTKFFEESGTARGDEETADLAVTLMTACQAAAEQRWNHLLPQPGRAP